MNGGESDSVSEEENGRLSKRARIDQDDNATSDDDISTGDPPPVSPSKSSTCSVAPELLEHAKSRLSKWAARLFDPDRPRGLVQAPETIPLNDEFLKAFGKRTKSEASDLKVETRIDSGDEGENDETMLIRGLQSTKKRKKSEGTKIKIINLAYTTDASLLRAACEKYGPLLDVNMIEDKSDSSLNAGRAFVTFEFEDDAQDCIDNLKELGGRSLRIFMAADRSATAPTPGGGGKNSSQSMLNQFAEKDISTICFRCGEVGHYEADCKNPAKPKPCCFCGSVDHNDRRCDQKMVCFNCGCPGHSVRECTERRGLPRRLVCSICFESGHHRNSCRNYRGTGAAAARDAVCMQCGQRGHFLCKEIKWFFGLKGIFCFNCGKEGHSGFQCQRPNLFRCKDEPNAAKNEIERAEAESVYVQFWIRLLSVYVVRVNDCSLSSYSRAENLQIQMQHTQQQSRGRKMGRDSGNNSSRHRSMPSQESRRDGQIGGPKNHQNGNRRGYN